MSAASSWTFGALFVATGAIGATVSCAGTEERAVDGRDASVIAPGADAADASCDGCGPKTPSCDEVDFCPTSLALAPTFALSSVWGSSASDVWAVGSGGSIAHYDGAAWTMLPSPSLAQGDTFRVVSGTGPNDVWVVGSAALLLHGTGLRDGAAEWTPAPIFDGGAAAALHALWVSANSVRVGGHRLSYYDEAAGVSHQGNHARIARDGQEWELLDGLADRFSQAIVRVIWGTAERDVWIAFDKNQTGDNERARGSLMHGTPDPLQGDALVWNEVDYRSNQALTAIWGSSADDIWVVGGRGAIRHVLAGKRAEIVAAPTDVTLHWIWGSSADDIWVVGDEGTILHFDGSVWTPRTAAFPAGQKPDLYGVWGSGPNDVWIVGDGPPLHFTGKKAGQ